MIISQYLGFCFYLFSRFSYRLDTANGCCPYNAAFIYAKAIQINKTYKIKSLIVDILHNYNHIYYSHKSNIKYVGLTIKYRSFEPILYTD